MRRGFYFYCRTGGGVAAETVLCNSEVAGGRGRLQESVCVPAQESRKYVSNTRRM